MTHTARWVLFPVLFLTVIIHSAYAVSVTTLALRGGEAPGYPGSTLYLPGNDANLNSLGQVVFDFYIASPSSPPYRGTWWRTGPSGAGFWPFLSSGVPPPEAPGFDVPGYFDCRLADSG